jgi:hypothetical protein
MILGLMVVLFISLILFAWHSMQVEMKKSREFIGRIMHAWILAVMNENGWLELFQTKFVEEKNNIKIAVWPKNTNDFTADNPLALIYINTQLTTPRHRTLELILLQDKDSPVRQHYDLISTKRMVGDLLTGLSLCLR